MNKKIITAVLAIIIIGGASFYGGIKFDQNQKQVATASRAGQFGGINNGFRSGRMGGVNGGLVVGSIVSKDANSVTVKMQDGSTKIILISQTTHINKSATGSIADLLVNTSVSVNGTTNSDGSLNAESVQIRPMMFATSTRSVQNN
jgi:hypothetical protein